MKHLYSWLSAILLMVVGLQANARECKLTLTVDNPDNVTATWDREPLALKAGLNTITYEGDEFFISHALRVETVSDSFILSVTSLTDGVNARPVQRGTIWEQWFYEENDGNAFNITTTDMTAVRTAECTITVLEDGGGITASRGGHAFPLNPGKNTVRFDPDTETEFVFTLSAWVSCHTFTVNGKDVEKQTYEYTVSLTDGDEVVIAVYDPVNTVPVTVTVNPEGVPAIRSVEVNHRSIEDWANFTVHRGELVGISCENVDYNVKSLKINGVEQEYHNYATVVADTDPINIEVVAAPWGNITFTVTSNIPQAVKMYYIEETTDEFGDPATIDSERFALVQGTARFEMPENKTHLVIVPRYGYATSVTDGNGSPVEFDGYIVKNIYDGMTFDLDSRELEYDSNFAVYLHGSYGPNESQNPNLPPTHDFDFCTYANAWAEDYTDIETGGYSVVPTISQHDIQWIFAARACYPGLLEVYLNDRSLTDSKEVGVWGDWFEMKFVPADGDVIRLYPKGAPARYDITFDIDADASGTLVVADHVKAVTDFAQAYRAFEGQHFAVTPADGAVVIIDGVQQTPDADGRVCFTADAVHTVAVAHNAGIADIPAGDAAHDTSVYNLQGVRVADRTEGLPAGLYIVAGKKVIVKH